ncbi:hypothetical protein NGM33_28460 [Nocardiopsis dassonvillei]|uniref:hypothetical protein n=1 Tax=Nocardiopsis dassonvillei TaxID=2014 RepID=UPI0020A41982|nr:hypothetical protein [Nocardiopsis dassonvillei]MCP3017269.1 hypothetical protein [Nocardiopsis dassonvillei]
MTLPHTYRTFNNSDGMGSEVVVREATVSVGLLNHLGRTTQELSTPTPKGEDAVALAKAVLEAAGDTGHRVVSEADLISAENAVVAMRQRAAYLVEYSDKPRAEIADEIRALPLLPDA